MYEIAVFFGRFVTYGVESGYRCEENPIPQRFFATPVHETYVTTTYRGTTGALFLEYTWSYGAYDELQGGFAAG